MRIFLTVILACQTYLPEDYVKGQPLSRDDLTCKVTYCSVGEYNQRYKALMLFYLYDSLSLLSQSRRLGTGKRLTRCLQARISQVSETLHQLCDRPVQG